MAPQRQQLPEKREEELLALAGAAAAAGAGRAAAARPPGRPPPRRKREPRLQQIPWPSPSSRRSSRSGPPCMPQTGREEEEEEEEEAGERREREEARRAKLLSQLHVLLGTPRPPLLLRRALRRGRCRRCCRTRRLFFCFVFTEEKAEVRRSVRVVRFRSTKKRISQFALFLIPNKPTHLVLHSFVLRTGAQRARNSRHQCRFGDQKERELRLVGPRRR